MTYIAIALYLLGMVPTFGSIDNKSRDALTNRSLLVIMFWPILIICGIIHVLVKGYVR